MVGVVSAALTTSQFQAGPSAVDITLRIKRDAFFKRRAKDTIQGGVKLVPRNSAHGAKCLYKTLVA